MRSYYTDILKKMNALKFRLLCKKHFGAEDPYWGSQNYKDIRAFVFDFLGHYIDVYSIDRRVQIGTGIPTWVISYE